MDAVTYPNSEVIGFLNENLIPLRIPFDAQPQATDFNIKWTPALIFLGPDGREHHRTIGFLNPADLIASLLLGTGKYHFDHDRLDEALAPFATVVADYSFTDSAPEAIFLAGVCRFKKDHNAIFLKEAYEKLSKDYPGNEWTKRAYPYRLI